MGNYEANVKVKMSRNYGTTTVEFELMTSEPVTIEAATIPADLMTSKIITLFEHFENQTLKQLGKSAKAAIQYNEVKVPASEIVWQTKDKKRFYRVKCGQWSGFGVAIYQEALDALNINGKEIPEDGYELPKGTMAIVQLENGEPKRVINLVRPK